MLLSKVDYLIKTMQCLHNRVDLIVLVPDNRVDSASSQTTKWAIAAGLTVLLLLLSFLHCAMSNHDPLRESDTASLSSSSTHIDIKHEPTHSPDVHPTEAPQPSIKLLFSFLTPRRKLVLLAPAVASSIAAGGIAPFMTYVVGRSFNAFAAFPLTPNPPQSAKDDLLHGVGLAAIELVALGFAALVMSSVTSSLWIWTGEHNVVELRRQVYRAVVHMQMEWFDRRMGADDASPAPGVQDASSSAPIGAGGLMAKFAR